MTTDEKRIQNQWVRRDLKTALANAPHPIDTAIARLTPDDKTKYRVVALVSSQYAAALVSFTEEAGARYLAYNRTEGFRLWDFGQFQPDPGEDGDVFG